MTIAFVNNQLQLGGAETVLDQLRAGVQRAGHQSRCHVAHGKAYPRDVQPLYPRGLSRLSHSRLHPLIERLFPRAAWTDRAFRRLARSDADVIHLHNFHGDYATLDSLAHVARRKPVIWTFHAFWGITGGCDHPQSCRRYAQRCGDCPQVGRWPVGATDRTAQQLTRKIALGRLPLHIVAPSQHLAAQVRASQVGCRWQVHRIPNGVNPAQFGGARKADPRFRAGLGLDPAATLVLVVNRNFRDAQKGFSIVSGALDIFAARDPRGAGDVQVVLAGGESNWAIGRLPSRLRCVNAGYVDSRARLAEWFEAADIFLFASPAENFPCVILEAMSAQCCVVATPTSGVIEQIEPRASGLLSDDLTAHTLAGALGEAVRSPDLRRACGIRARARLEGAFSEHHMVQAHLELYTDVATRRAHGAHLESAA